MDALEESDAPAIQVIVLGSGGGPLETNTTALLVRSTATEWSRGSVLAVDAGVHLAAIAKILDETVSRRKAGKLSAGPFRGMTAPMNSATALAGYIQRDLIDTYIITHPHLDHIAAFVINTASLAPSARPKRLAGLHTTIDAFKTHIFNNVIWPNLADESGGAGLVTYLRLLDGGSPALGEGDAKGYVEVVDGLAVKTWGVSHGHCIERHAHPISGSSLLTLPSPSLSGASPHLAPTTNDFSPGRSSSNSTHRRPGWLRRDSASFANPQETRTECVYDSSAYFIRDVATGKEVLIFGDVEPDSISLLPRTKHVWADAAPKIFSGSLRAIFIECSYDDSREDSMLFGHLTPAHLVAELVALARLTKDHKASKEKERKNKRKLEVSNQSGAGTSKWKSLKRDESEGPRGRIPGPGFKKDLPHPTTTARPTNSRRNAAEISPSRVNPNGEENPLHESQKMLSSLAVRPADGSSPPSANVNEEGRRRATDECPLRGLKIVVMHVKDILRDGEPPEERIGRQLRERGQEVGLGCEFIISHQGTSLFF